LSLNGIAHQGRMSREKRRALMREAQSLKTGGLRDSEIVDALLRQNEGISKKSAQRVLAMMYADFDRDAKRRRKGQLGSTLASIDRAKRIAITKQRFIVVDGTLEKHLDPDGKGYLDAVEAEAKLLGLNAPERREIYVATFDAVFAELAEAMREEVVDPLPPARELLLRLARRFKTVMEGGARTLNSPHSNIMDISSVSVVNSSSNSKDGNFAPQSEPKTGGQQQLEDGTNGTAK
jgi:hypothetical protein